MKPRIIIVDENDEIIGYKARGTLKSEDIYRVSYLWLTNTKGQVLLARRAFTKSHHPGKWGPAVAGTIEEGETYDSNIIKEAEEELGLKGFKFTKGIKQRKPGKYDYFSQQYLLTADIEIDQFKVQEEEVAEIKWFSKAELASELKRKPDEFLKSMKKFLERF